MIVQYLWWSDPFLEFFKQTETGWQLAHRTEVHIFTNSSLCYSRIITYLWLILICCM